MSNRRLLIVLVAGLLFSFGGAAVLQSVEKQPTSVGAPQLSSLVIPPPAPTTTAAPIAAAPPTTVRTRRPAAPVAPKESSAEPIVLLGRIEIPKIGLAHDVYHGITMRNIDRGPSHWPGTAFPGEIGNTVFAGHRVTKTKPFFRINELVPGDRVIFDIQGQRSTYEMTGSEIVTPDRLDIVRPTETATATLFACHPRGSAKYRYVVRLALVAS
ncbi:MAG TPA: class E sortase [Acidimicrobiales bacterium]|nr:class E sortase [Acidimicrobiales bacterium]